MTRGLLTALMGMSVVTAPVAAEDPAEQRERAARAAQVLREMMRAEDTAIPQALLERAKAIAVVPHMVKGADEVTSPFVDAVRDLTPVRAK